MRIEKSGITYTVTDCGAFWKVESTSGKLNVCYKIPKIDCTTSDEVREYILASDIF